MTVYHLFRSKAFEPEVLEVMTSAYTDVCRTLGFSERDRDANDVVAKKVIEFVQRGVRNKTELRDHVLQALQR